MNTDLFEIIRTTRSMRRLKPDPVPAELIRQILDAGIAAANGGNMQTWRFMVIRDSSIKTEVAQWYRRAWHETVAPRYRAGAPAPGSTRDRFDRMLAAAEHLADHLQDAPVWIVPCLQGGTHSRTSGASIYPAVQNMLLTARALGLGATLTTLYLLFEKQTETAMGLPEDAHSYAILPIGYPLGKFGPVGRTSLQDVVFADHWGQKWSDA
ncbi:nitroreductase family protein [Rhodopila sp.]|uniref:nitroreductase family protein n=1 Tax=Rhodopila sp. TaxID=2480087 RepID=UPI003D0A0269